jgi:anti-sigma B factor antagonist
MIELLSLDRVIQTPAKLRKEIEMEQSKIKTEYGIDITFVTFEDEKILEEAQIRDLQKKLEPVIDKNKENQLVLNFANVRFMTSAMLGLLVRIHKRVNERGGKLELRNLDNNLHKLFEITQLTKIFNIT